MYQMTSTCFGADTCAICITLNDGRKDSYSSNDLRWMWNAYHIVFKILPWYQKKLTILDMKDLIMANMIAKIVEAKDGWLNLFDGEALWFPASVFFVWDPMIVK